MEQFVNFKEGKIAFTDQGKGNCIFLVHGFICFKEIWKEVVPALSKKFRVVTLDLPGHGESDTYGYVQSMELLAKSIKAVCDQLEINEMVLVGHSMGGYASLAFADLYPENLKGLFLFHSTSYADSEQKKKDRDRAIKAVKSNHNVYVKDTVKNLFAQEHLAKHRKELALVEKGAEKISKRALVACLEGMKERADRRNILRSKKFPVHLLIGKFDIVMNQDDLREQAKVLGKNNVTEMENSGHMGMLEETEKSVATLQAFAESCFT